MAFRASSVLTKTAYDSVRAIATQIKKRAEIILPLLDSNVARENVLEYGQTLENQLNQLITFESADLLQWARDQENDQTYNVQTEYVAMKSAIEAIIASIRSTYPAPSGFLATKQFAGPATLNVVDGVFTPTQTQGLKALIQALVATIE